MSKRLTVIYEVPDDYNVTRITGTGELNVVRCESMDVMQELGKVTARLAAAEAAMKAAASLPGRLWLTGQLAIAEFLSGEGGEHLDYALEQYEAAKAGGRDVSL